MYLFLSLTIPCTTQKKGTFVPPQPNTTHEASQYNSSHGFVPSFLVLNPNTINICCSKRVNAILQYANNLFYGLIDNIIPRGVAILQYADDTIICLKHDLEGARRMKMLLYLFEMLSGLKINFNKSEILMINDDEEWGKQYAEIFNCQLGFFPVKYLGVPVSPSRLHLVDWLPLIEKCNKRLDVWKGGNMTMAGRTTLICSSLNNSPIYHMSVFLLPKTTLKEIDKLRRTFFWQGGGTKRK
jgi:hypothetical protein